MSVPEPQFRIISRNFTTEWSDALQQAVRGVRYQISNPATGNVIPMFIPSAHDTPEDVQAMAIATVQHDSAIMSLGTQ